MPGRVSLIVVLLVGALLATASPATAQDGGCAPPERAGFVPGLDVRGVSPKAPNPLEGSTWFVDPEERANVLQRQWASSGRTRDAARLEPITREPRFRWFGAFTRPDVRAKTRAFLERVQCAQPGAVPLMTVLRHQGKGCGNYDGGGSAEDERTRQWYREFAEAIGGARVVIAFEPDSLGTIDCLAPARRRARLRLLAYGVDQLAKLPRATIYLEAGASDWEPAKRTAKQLEAIGIAKVRGFMLNVTHYDWTANNIRHGLDISRRVGGKHFIISTAFNGRGPVHIRRRIGGRVRRLNVWCHPLKRGLGPAPTTDTAHSRVDAYMWIGRPGYSGGKCNGGPLPIGTFWPERALMFSTYATDWIRPPKGTVNGLRGRFTPRQLGYCGPPCV